MTASNAAGTPMPRQLLDVLTFQAGYNTSVVLLGTLLLGSACGVIGSFLLLRKRSLVADALSHAALPGVCLGFILGTMLGMEGKSLWLLLPAAGFTGLLGVACIHLLSTLPRVKEDAAIGAVLSVFFAVGLVLLGVIQTMPTGNQAGLQHFIFGQAASMVGWDLAVIVMLAAISVVLPLLLFKELRLTCFDASFAQSLGWSTLVIDGLLLSMVTLVTVAGLQAVGAVLMVALLIVPPAAARFWTNKLWLMVAIASAIGGAGCFLGTAASAVLPDVPTGPAIVIACGVIFIFSMTLAPRRGLVVDLVERLRLGRRIARQHLLRAMYECGEMAGDPAAPVTIDLLRSRRGWTSAQLNRRLSAAIRRGEVVRDGPAFALSETGRDDAARIVRTHRLWEHFLTTQADIAPSHVDRAADDIEHVLSSDLVHDLETSLRESGALAQGETVPRSPHGLSGDGGLNPANEGAA